jgi:hypothetical protein
VISRYGQAIERDLLERYGLDLAREFHGRRWRRLLNLIDNMPRNSGYVQAMVEDEEYAEAVVDMDKRQEPAKPRRHMAEWSVEVELLSSLLDRLGELISVSMVAAGAKKAPKVAPAPRPATAFERVRNRRRWQQHHSLVARVLPAQNTQGGEQQ